MDQFGSVGGREGGGYTTRGGMLRGSRRWRQAGRHRQAGRQRGAAWCSTSSAVEFDFIKNAGILCLESASTIIHSQRAVLRRQFPREGRLDSWNSEERTSVLLIEFGFVLRTVANGGLDQGDWTIKSHWRQKKPACRILSLPQFAKRGERATKTSKFIAWHGGA